MRPRPGPGVDFGLPASPYQAVTAPEWLRPREKSLCQLGIAVGRVNWILRQHPFKYVAAQVLIFQKLEPLKGPPVANNRHLFLMQ